MAASPVRGENAEPETRLQIVMGVVRVWVESGCVKLSIRLILKNDQFISIKIFIKINKNKNKTLTVVKPTSIIVPFP